MLELTVLPGAGDSSVRLYHASIAWRLLLLRLPSFRSMPTARAFSSGTVSICENQLCSPS